MRYAAVVMNAMLYTAAIMHAEIWVKPDKLHPVFAEKGSISTNCWPAPFAGGVALLAPLLRGAGAPAANQQVLYDAGLAVWQLTYYRPAAEIMGTTGEHTLAA